MDLARIKSRCPLRDGAHLAVAHKSQMLSLLSEFILSEARTWLNLGSRLPSSFIEWSLSSVGGRRRPCQTRLARMTAAIDIFTASSSTDFAYAYTTYSHIVLSHCDFLPEICFVMGVEGGVCVNVWLLKVYPFIS